METISQIQKYRKLYYRNSWPVQPVSKKELSYANYNCYKVLKIYTLHCHGNYLTIIELTMWPCVCACVRVWQPTPKTADVTVTKIAGYVRILVNRWFFHIFGIHGFYATATLLNIWICMRWADAANDGCGGGLDFAPMHAVAPSRGFPACYI